ncbi:winged helix-turn-helix domain-containing protein [Candidatus Thorarchaeota archaeon]|nr:MAG: winged helix-turn-helix domain-containing protein [Candidatus Thorarchaeota archaeon]
MVIWIIPMFEISIEEARDYILDAQGLRTTNPCKSVIDVARRIHNIQIDTISVLSRSHNITTFNRYDKYEDGQIWNELKKGNLFEFWSHSICLMPIETYPYYKWIANSYAKRTKGWPVEWGVKNPQIVEEVYNHVKKNGPTASRDIGSSGSKREGWWDWKVEKHALEYLFTTGRLMIAFREKFQKYYDLTERVLPSSIPNESLSDQEAAEFAAVICVKSLGLASWQDVKLYTGTMVYRDLWGSTKKLQLYLESLVDAGKLGKVSIPGVQETYYILKSRVNKLQNFRLISEPGPMKFICPFDNVIRERHLPSKLWSFDYKIEAYTPPPERRYGYFVLPILYGNKFVGRLDAKVHREKSIFEVKALFLESENWSEDDVLSAFRIGLNKFAQFHGCEEIIIGTVTPKKMTHRVRSLYN